MGSPSGEARLSRGRTREGASFPTPPSLAHLPETYVNTLEEIKRHIQHARVRAVLAANAVVITAYWQTGKIILQRQQEQSWGTRVIDRLSHDLREAFPGMEGLSSRNLLSMKLLALAFPEDAIAKQPVSQLPWGHIIRLLQMVKDPATRDFYIRETITHGWSRSIMQMQIRQQLHLRHGKAQNNFPATLPPPDSDLATQAFKDPYLFDFLGTADLRREAEVEQALVDHIQQFLLEMGAGFAFVGRQVRLEVGVHDFPIDLLFHHLRLRRYVVVELKSRDFVPGDVGQINLYRAAVDVCRRTKPVNPGPMPTSPSARPSLGHSAKSPTRRNGFSNGIGSSETSATTPANEESLPGKIPQIVPVGGQLRMALS